MGEIMEYLFFFIFFSMAGVIMYFLNRLQLNAQKKTKYVCNLCDENHCECTQE